MRHLSFTLILLYVSMSLRGAPHELFLRPRKR